MDYYWALERLLEEGFEVVVALWAWYRISNHEQFPWTLALVLVLTQVDYSGLKHSYLDAFERLLGDVLQEIRAAPAASRLDLAVLGEFSNWERQVPSYAERPKTTLAKQILVTTKRPPRSEG